MPVLYRQPRPPGLLLAGLSSFEAPAEARRRRRRRTICASERLTYEWLRVNPCIEEPIIGEDEVPTVRSSREAAAFIGESFSFRGRGVEYAMVLALDAKNRPVSIYTAAMGGRRATAIDPTVVFQAAILSNAIAFIFAHNHPSNQPSPSPEDVAFTERLVKGANYVGLTMLDSMILTDHESVYFSFLDSGIMPR